MKTSYLIKWTEVDKGAHFQYVTVASLRLAIDFVNRPHVATYQIF